MRAAQKIRRGVLVIWAVASLLSWAALSTQAFFSIESATWDMRQRLIADPAQHDSKIKIIMVDQSSLDHFARQEQIYWPWPRSLYAPVLFYLQRAGARGVAFDMLFTESSSHVGDDGEFAQAVAHSLPVVSAISLRREAVDGDPSLEALFKAAQERRRVEIGPYVRAGVSPEYPSATLPIDLLIESSPALGNVTAEADSDKIFRHAQAGAFVRGTPVLNLPLALFNLVHPGAEKAAELRQLAGPSGKLLVRFFGPEATYQSFSIAAVINSYLKLEQGQQPDIPLEEFKDSYVLIGTNAPGLLDLRPVPMAGNFPGVELNATVLDNIIHSSFMQHVPDWVAALVTVGFLGLVSLVSMRATSYQVGLIAATIVSWSGIAYVSALFGWWIPVVVPLTGAMCVLPLVFLLQYQVEGREHRFIKGAFQHYVTPAVIEQIVRDPSALSLGGDRRELTIFFSDIAGFTTISERMQPDRLVAFLNRFLSEMTDILLASGGTIDKYEGDAIIAFWNAPLAVADHEKRAVQAALACQHRLKELRGFFKREFDVDLRMRIGIHTGIVTVGNFGSSTRFNYTVIGDAANLASRLEGTNKVFGTPLLVSAETRRRAGEEQPWREIGRVRVVGRSEPVPLFQPLDTELDEAVISRLGEFDQARILFERGRLSEAQAIFAKFADDPVSQAYCQRISLEMESGKTFSPVWTLTEK